MKKVIVLATALFAIATMGVFADGAAQPQFAPAVSVGGSATLTWGINLDGVDTGFANGTSSSITLTLVPAGSVSKGGKEGETTYGTITLDSWAVSIAGGAAVTGTAPTVSTAKIVLGGAVYVNILKAGTSTGYASIANLLNDSDNFISDSGLGTGNNSFTETGTIKVGLVDTSVVDVSVVVSEIDGYAATSAGVNTYNFGVYVGLTAVKDLTFAVAADLSTAAGSAIGIAAKAGYKIGIAEGYSLSVLAAFDIKLATATAWDLSVGLGLALPGSGPTVAFTSGPEISFASGLQVGFDFDSANDANLIVRLADGDLIPVIAVAAAFEIGDLLGTADINLGAYVSADIGVGSVFAQFSADLLAPAAFYLKAGVTLNVITNTSFVISYASGDLGATTPVLGTITVAATISY